MWMHEVPKHMCMRFECYGYFHITAYFLISSVIIFMLSYLMIYEWGLDYESSCSKK